MSKVTPEKIESIVLEDVEQYERVGLSHEGWVNGATPINEDNLNIGDLALYKLLGSKESGYIQRLVSSLNSETAARSKDVTNLDSALSIEALDRRGADKTLENSIDSLRQTHNQDVTRLEAKDQQLQENIEKVAEDLSKTEADLRGTINSVKVGLENADAALRRDLEEESSRAKTAEETLAQEFNTAINTLQEQLVTEDARIEAAIPLKVSQLENDAGYLTEHQSLDNYYTKQEVAEEYATKDEVVSVQDELILNCGSATTLI